MTEPELIASLLRPLTLGAAGAFGLANDAAVVPGTEADAAGALVATTDCCVEGTHFRAGDAAGGIGGKALRRNLSDLAAMGALPTAALSAMVRAPHWDDAWMRAYTAGLHAELEAFAVPLIGGDLTRALPSAHATNTSATPNSNPHTRDTTASPSAGASTASTPDGASEAASASPSAGVIVMTLLGRASGPVPGHTGVRAGERLWVSGSLGEGALGLLALEQPAHPAFAALAPEARASLVARYHTPLPRLALGAALAHHVSACIDISDGLLADAGKLAAASAISLQLSVESLPLSTPVRDALTAAPALLDSVLGGGDDYELLFTAPESATPSLVRAASACGIAISEIGVAGAGSGVSVCAADGSPLQLRAASGWDPFAHP